MKPPEDKNAARAIEIAAKALSVKNPFPSNKSLSASTARGIAFHLLHVNGWKKVEISRVFTTSAPAVLSSLRRLRRILNENPALQRRLKDCLDAFGFAPPPAKEPTRRLCECGEVAAVKFDGAFICQRCATKDANRWAEEQSDKRSKYYRVYSYTLPQGSALN